MRAERLWQSGQLIRIPSASWDLRGRMASAVKVSSMKEDKLPRLPFGFPLLIQLLNIQWLSAAETALCVAKSGNWISVVKS